MKTFLKIGCALAVVGVLLIGGLIAVVFWMTSGLTETAGQFFDGVKAKSASTAYAATSKGFRNATTENELSAFLDSTGLSGFQSVSWSNRSITNGEGDLRGSVTTADGAQIPIHISLVKEEGAWKIQSIRPGAAGITENSEKIPSSTELQMLVQSTMKTFADSINGGDFKPFYDDAALVWKSQTTPEKLREIFKAFIDQSVDLLPLQNLQPKFEPAPVLDQGTLIVKGDYDTGPLKVVFELSYVREGITWKVVGTNVKVTPNE